MRLPAFSTGVVLFFASFPTALTTPTARTNAMPSNLQRVADEFDIKQTGNLFTVLIDSNRFSELGNVFTEDAHANFATNETMNLQGLTAISNFLQVLSNVTSQHSYTTQYANLTSPTTGHFTGYFQGLFYGQGTLAGQVYQSFGTYVTRGSDRCPPLISSR